MSITRTATRHSTAVDPTRSARPTAAHTHAPTRTTSRPRLDGRVLIDLSAVGVAATSTAEAFEPTTQKTDLAHVARMASAAHDAGTDLVVLGPNFRLASGRKHAPDAWLDPALAVRRLGATATGAGITPCVAVGHRDIAAAASLGGVARKSRWKALAVRAAVDPFGVQDADELTRELLPAVAAGLGARDTERPLLLTHATSTAQAEVAGRHADIVRIHARDAAAARVLREAVNAGAREVGRAPSSIRVLLDVRVVLSQDAAAARERVLLLDALASPDEHAPLDAIGSVAEVAAQLETWVREGVCDGAVLVPGSLQADTSATLHRLLPALAEGAVFGAARP